MPTSTRHKRAGIAFISAASLAGLLLLPMVAHARPLERTGAAVPISSSASAPAFPDVSERRLMSEQEAIAEDATASGLSSEQLTWSRDFNLAVTRIMEKYPDDFSFARADPARSAGEVRFKGDVPAEALALLGTVRDVAFTGGTGYSQRELNDDVSAILRVAEEFASDLGNGYASADDDAHTITVVFDQANDTSADPRSAQEVRSRVEEAITTMPRQAPSFKVAVRASMEPVVATEAFDGGWRMAVASRGSASLHDVLSHREEREHRGRTAHCRSLRGHG